MKVEVEVTLRPTVSRPVCQGVEPTLGLMTKYYFMSERCCLKVSALSSWSALSDDRSGLSFVILSLQQFISICTMDLRFLYFSVQPGSVQQIY
jgi:hypothetical protein